MNAPAEPVIDDLLGGTVNDLRRALDLARAERDQLRSLVLAMSDAIDLTRAVADANARALAVEAAERARRDGYEAGARWLVSTAPRIAAGPSYTELDERRYGPGGRAGCLYPRPEVESAVSAFAGGGA